MEKIAEKINHQMKMNEFIDLIEKIEGAGIKGYIELPRFCVIGGFNIGKSSVIENILNLDFLPRVDTMKPVEIKINHIKDNYQAYATSEELNSLKIYYDFSQLKQELENILENYDYNYMNNFSKIENDKGALHVNIYSPNLPSITIIDLPPIIRNRYEYCFDWKEKKSRNIINNYINNESKIILCLMHAMTTFEINEELRMAKEIDFNGKRTLGIVTKIDIMDSGTDCSKSLLTQEYL